MHNLFFDISIRIVWLIFAVYLVAIHHSTVEASLDQWAHTHVMTVVTYLGGVWFTAVVLLIVRV